MGLTLVSFTLCLPRRNACNLGFDLAFKPLHVICLANDRCNQQHSCSEAFTWLAEHVAARSSVNGLPLFLGVAGCPTLAWDLQGFPFLLSVSHLLSAFRVARSSSPFLGLYTLLFRVQVSHSRIPSSPQSFSLISCRAWDCSFITYQLFMCWTVWLPAHLFSSFPGFSHSQSTLISLWGIGLLTHHFLFCAV